MNMLNDSIIDGFIEYIGDLLDIPLFYFNHSAPAILDPIGFRRCYNRLAELQSSNDGIDNLACERALYHTRHRTKFYADSQG